LNADVTFDGQRAAIGRFSIADNDNRVLSMSGGGDVFATGRARAFDIRIATDGFAVLRNELGDVDIRADAQAQGDLASPRISGSIAIARGRIEVDELLRRSTTPARAPAPVTARVGWVTRTSAPQPPAPGTPTAQADAARVAEAPSPSPSPWANAVVNLTIRIPDNLVLRGRDLRSGSVAMGLGDLNLTIGGNLDVRKEAGTPIGVVGSLQTVRGFYDFQGRRFDVVRGSTVSFRGPEVTNPSLDITGQREVSGVVAEVHVTGTLQRPRLLLSSQPSLEEGDILSLIIFNQPINQLGESEQVDLVDRATQLALGALATSLSTSIGNALDVDLFEIRAPSTGQAGEVTIGRQVSDRLFVGFRQEFGEADATRLSFEYRLTDALRILTSVAQGTERSKRSRDQEAAGVDLVFRVRY
jgi:autotransporter translocation and assembly factor TamB